MLGFSVARVTRYALRVMRFSLFNIFPDYVIIKLVFGANLSPYFCEYFCYFISRRNAIFCVLKILNMSENINEILMNRETRAAGELREGRAQERVAASGEKDENSLQGSTPRQKLSIARLAEEAKKSAENPPIPAGASGVATAGTSKALSFAWKNMLNPIAIPLALAYINTHVFGHSVFGEKVFCALGEEFIPANLRTGMSAKEFKKAAKMMGLLEIIVLCFLDLIALFALLGLLAILVKIASFYSDSLVGKAQQIFQAISTLGWGAVSAILSLF